MVDWEQKQSSQFGTLNCFDDVDFYQNNTSKFDPETTNLTQRSNTIAVKDQYDRT